MILRKWLLLIHYDLLITSNVIQVVLHSMKVFP